jgi:DNA-damage-inducible protein J
MSELCVTLDGSMKEDTAVILEELGLDFATAISIYFKQIVQRKKIPIELSAKKYYTAEEVMGENWQDGLDEIEDEWE